MGEMAAAVDVVLEPLRKARDSFFISPYLQFSHLLIDIGTRYGVDSSLGHDFLRAFVSPSLSWGFSRFYNNRKLMYKFGDLPQSSKTLIVGTAALFNKKVLTEPLNELISKVATIYCGVQFGQEAREDAELFFFLCKKQSKGIVGFQLGTGNIRDTNNVFFPFSLGYGVRKPQVQEVYRLSIKQKTLKGLKVLTKHKEMSTNCKALKKVTPNFGFEVKATVSSDEHSDTDSDNILTNNNIDIPISNENGDSNGGENLEEGKSEEINEYQEHKDNLPEYSTSFLQNQQKASFRKIVNELLKTKDGREIEKEGMTSWSIEKTRVEIAMSCLLFSTLTYRSFKELKFCMDKVFLPGVQLLSLDTGESGTSLLVFIDDSNKYAVFCYRGTQFEVIRQLLTSVDFKTEDFYCSEPKAKVRGVYLREVNKSFENYRFEQKYDKRSWTPQELARYFVDKNFKTYITGHSLGGGLATVLAAKLAAQNIAFTAVVTFGATPVGNTEFVKFFNKSVNCSWRFVFGEEFAPCVPPLPFLQPSECTELVHVKGLVHFATPTDFGGKHKTQSPRTAVEIERRLGEISSQCGLIKVLADHNPMLTLRALKQYRVHPLEKLTLPVN